MFEDYCNRLQLLNQQKNSFLKLKYQSSSTNKLKNLQNKYHKYILTQIQKKNSLNACFKFNKVVEMLMWREKKYSFDTIIQSGKKQLIKEMKTEKKEEINVSNDRSSTSLKGDILIQSLKLKMKDFSCSIFSRWSFKHQKKQSICAFVKMIKRNHKIHKGLQFLFQVCKKKIDFQKNVFFKMIKNGKQKIQQKKFNYQQRPQSRSFIFSLNEFSQIIPYTIEQLSEELSTSRIKDIQEIDSKFKPISCAKIQPSQIIQNQQNEYTLMLKSLQKLKQQVYMMKSLLLEKNRQIKLKDQQLCKLKKEYEKKIQTIHDELSSRIQYQYQNLSSCQSKGKKGSKIRNFQSLKQANQNNTSEYLKQLQDHIIGDRSPRGLKQDGDHVHDQLLQKYMKQTFEMRQKMDMARQLCQQFEFDTRTEEGQIMIEIIKLLTPQQRLNALVVD